MKHDPGNGIHIDPSRDERAHPTLDFLGDLWDQVVRFRTGAPHEAFVIALLMQLESRLVATALILKIKSEMSD